MSKASVLNALTRLLLLVVAVLWFTADGRLWLSVLVAGLVTIGLLYLFNVKGKQGFREDFRRVYPIRPFAPVVTETPVEDLQLGRKPRVGLVGTETKTIPRTSIVRLEGVEPTVVFRKR